MSAQNKLIRAKELTPGQGFKHSKYVTVYYFNHFDDYHRAIVQDNFEPGKSGLLCLIHVTPETIVEKVDPVDIKEPTKNWVDYWTTVSSSAFMLPIVSPSDFKSIFDKDVSMEPVRFESEEGIYILRKNPINAIEYFSGKGCEKCFFFKRKQFCGLVKCNTYLCDQDKKLYYTVIRKP